MSILSRLSFDICIQSRSYLSKSCIVITLQERQLLPCTFTKVYMNRGTRPFINSTIKNNWNIKVITFLIDFTHLNILVGGQITVFTQHTQTHKTAYYYIFFKFCLYRIKSLYVSLNNLNVRTTVYIYFRKLQVLVHTREHSNPNSKLLTCTEL